MVAWYERGGWSDGELLWRQVLLAVKFVYASFVRGDLPAEIFRLELRSLELFNKMPDIGSSQNVQTVQEPEVNGNATQNGDKSPNDEVCVIFLVSHDNYAGL